MRHLIARLAIAAVAVTASVVAGSPAASFGGIAQHQRAVPSLACEAPRALRLERYEDGSAKLLCAGRLLARVTVPW